VKLPQFIIPVQAACRNPSYQHIRLSRACKKFSRSLLILLAAAVLLLIPLFASAAAEKPVVFSGDDVRWYTDERVTIEGNAKVTYSDYTVDAQSVDTDLKTNVVTFKGTVTLSMNGQKVQGEELKLNLKTREWSLEKAKSAIEPTLLQGQTSGKAFIQGAELKGNGKNEVDIESGSLTTCDKDHPHYCLRAHDMEVYPGSRIVAHKVSVYGLEKKLATLGVLVIPIKNINRNLLPQVGSSVEEGTFIKSAIPYSASAAHQGFLKLDLMEKKGIGAGLDHNYKLESGEGAANLYFLRDNQLGGNNLTGHIQHHQKFGLLDTNFISNYRQNSYLYYPASTSRDWQLALNYNRPKSNTSLNVQSMTNSGYGTYTNSFASFRHMSQFSNTLSSVLSMDMRASDTGNPLSNTKNLESTIEMRDRGKKFDLSLTANKATNLNKSNTFGLYGGLEKLPELSIETDTYRLGGKSPLGLDSRLLLTTGQYNETSSKTNKGRILMQWDLLDKPINFGDKNILSFNAGIRQTYYASDMAQYILKTGTTFTSNLSDYMRARISYSYQRPEGFSPFLFDYSGKYNYARAVVDYQQSKLMKWSISSGYDWYSPYTPWQDIALHLSSHPNSQFGYSVGAGYNLNNSLWKTLTFQYQLNMPKRVSIDLGSQYDTQRHSLLTRGRFDWRINELWRIEGITSWNGDIKKFDYRAFRLTRDLHCMEAMITYTDESGFNVNRGFSFDLRIKALPFLDRFGINQYGQRIDTTMGQYYF